MTEFVVVVVVAFEQIPSRYPIAGLSWKYKIFLRPDSSDIPSSPSWFGRT